MTISQPTSTYSLQHHCTHHRSSTTPHSSPATSPSIPTLSPSTSSSSPPPSTTYTLHSHAPSSLIPSPKFGPSAQTSSSHVVSEPWVHAATPSTLPAGSDPSSPLGGSISGKVGPENWWSIGEENDVKRWEILQGVEREAFHGNVKGVYCAAKEGVVYYVEENEWRVKMEGMLFAWGGGGGRGS